MELSGTEVVLLDTGTIDPMLQLANMYRTQDRMFLPAVRSDSWAEEVLVLGVTDTGGLAVSTVSLDRQPVSSQAVGTNLYFIHGGELAMVDASDAASPTRSRVAELVGEGTHMALTADSAIVSLGDSGVQVIPL